MAHKKAAGTARNLRDSSGKRLGIKLFGGQAVKNGNIICRQRGTKWRSGEGTKVGVDHTIYAIKDGVVAFEEKKRVRYDGRKYTYTYITVVDSTVKKEKAVKAAPKKEVVKVAPKAEAKKAPAKKVAPKTTAKKKTTTKKAE